MPYQYRRMVQAAREGAEAEPSELIHKGGFKPCLPEEALNHDPPLILSRTQNTRPFNV